MTDQYSRDCLTCSDVSISLLNRQDPVIFTDDGRTMAERFAERIVPIANKSVPPSVIKDLAEWAFSWTIHGMPRVCISHKLSASYMATRIPSDFGDSIRSPWKFFQVIVPPGTMADTEITALVRSVHVNDEFGVSRHGARVIWLQPNYLGNASKSNNMRICAPWGEFANPDVDDKFEHTEEQRTSEAMMRLLFGVVLRLNSNEAVLGQAKNPQLPRRKHDIPQAWTLSLSDPVRVDVRAAVRAYISGQGKSMTKQGIVRGHWKMQPYGPQSSLRKFIHIEPFWRGPEDAPIAVRPHILSGEGNASNASG